ncbi:scarecrow-like protein 33 [Triticum aestivum]|uniref:scarecrow-like protein 33 n=1 Tax=Triticum aestivum TaxID=4565 RepID=UPI001D01EC11|nr:scarecrow-like protein 33 [Triticum aestivum]
MAPTPYVFPNPNLQPAPALQQPHDDLALDYISRMLMEEDIVDKFIYQYPDPAALLQAQHPFAQILTTTSSDMLTSALPIRHIQNPAFFLNDNGVADPNNSMDMISSMAFFRGMEEANRFLPRYSGAVEGSNMPHGGGGNGAEAGRSSKQMAVQVHPESKEESDMLDQFMLNSYDMCTTEARERCDEAEQQPISTKAPRGRRGARLAVVDDLETLLIRCAEAVATNDQRSACELLWRVKRHSSPTGDATQRLAHYFAEGLEARLAGRGSQLYRSLMVKCTPVVEVLKAYKLFMSACCFMKVCFLFSNKTIYNAVMGRHKLHIVHYGVNDGFQWPDLLRWLAEREGGPPKVRITSITSLWPGFRPAEQTYDTGQRLYRCAKQFGVPFEFRVIPAKAQDVRVEDLDINPDEVLVVNSLIHFRSLMDESVVIDRLNPRDMVLNTIRKMKPAVFVHAIVNASYNTTFFVTRFRQVLHNFAAHFDMMEATVPRDNDERLLVERDIIARCAMNIIACEGTDRVERPQNYREWQARNQRAGLRQLALDPDIVQFLKDIVKKQYHKHFVINEDHQWLLQGWKGRVLYAISTWVSDDASSTQVT